MSSSTEEKTEASSPASEVFCTTLTDAPATVRTEREERGHGLEEQVAVSRLEPAAGALLSQPLTSLPHDLARHDSLGDGVRDAPDERGPAARPQLVRRGGVNGRVRGAHEGKPSQLQGHPRLAGNLRRSWDADRHEAADLQGKVAAEGNEKSKIQS